MNFWFDILTELLKKFEALSKIKFKEISSNNQQSDMKAYIHGLECYLKYQSHHKYSCIRTPMHVYACINTYKHTHTHTHTHTCMVIFTTSACFFSFLVLMIININLLIVRPLCIDFILSLQNFFLRPLF